MATDAENLATIKSNALEVLADLSANPKPTYNLDGQLVSWTEYQRMMMQQVQWADEQLNAAEPFELHHQGYT